MSESVGSILLLGMGNTLLRDEGVGVHVARALSSRSRGLPPGTRVIDAGTMGLDLLPLITGAAAVVFVDAMDVGAPPGSVSVLRDREIAGALGSRLSPHQVGLADLIAAGRLCGSLPGRVTLVGIQPASIEVGLELTPDVRGALPRAVEAARRELWAAAEPA
jgi:hydrogenase maturation protease